MRKATVWITRHFPRADSRDIAPPSGEYASFSARLFSRLLGAGSQAEIPRLPYAQTLPGVFRGAPRLAERRWRMMLVLVSRGQQGKDEVLWFPKWTCSGPWLCLQILFQEIMNETGDKGGSEEAPEAGLTWRQECGPSRCSGGQRPTGLSRKTQDHVSNE